MFQKQKAARKRLLEILMLAGLTGLEPATSGVTGRRSNQLSYNPASTAKAILQKLAPFVKKEVEKTCGYGPRGQRPAYHQSDYASVVGVTPSLGAAACGLRSSRPWYSGWLALFTWMCVWLPLSFTAV